MIELFSKYRRNWCNVKWFLNKFHQENAKQILESLIR